MIFAGSLERNATDEYRRLIKIAQIADEENFSGFWLPERHYTQFGGPYPKPQLLLAALATRTKRISLRAGSIVAPLHDPLSIAEDLCVLDNLSNGRVEAAFASGWHPNDFASRPAAYAERRPITLARAQDVTHLWSGGSLQRENGLGESVAVSIFPRPCH